jgi:hypothetical protein
MAKKIDITLDDEHCYRVQMDGNLREVPSVTTIMKDVGYYPWIFSDKKDSGVIEFPSEKMTPAARGTRIHNITEDIDRGIEVDPIDPELLPFIDAYRQFKSDNTITITQIEEIVFNEDYWFAGALDRVMQINGVPSIVDIKTGAKMKTTGVQLAAYRYAWEQMGGQKDLARFALHLNDSGKYKLVPYRSAEDLPDFMAAIRVYNFKRNK